MDEVDLVNDDAAEVKSPYADPAFAAAITRALAGLVNGGLGQPKPHPAPVSYGDFRSVLGAISEMRWAVDALENRLLELAAKIAAQEETADGRPQ
jgi:hypothetical protein